MSAKDQPQAFKPLRQTAALLGVPLTWLRAEIRVGRFPYLKIGRRIFLDTDEARRILVDRARQTTMPTDQDTEGRP